MMKDSQLLDDLARLAGGAAGGLLEVKRTVEEMVGAQLGKLLGKMQLVTREEFEVVRLMAAKAREEQEKMALKLQELETRLSTHER